MDHDATVAMVCLALSCGAARSVSGQSGARIEVGTGFGFTLAAGQVRHRATIRSVFMGIPKVRIVGPTMGPFELLLATPGGGTCVPTFYLDGLRADPDDLHAFRPQQVARVEVYARSSTAPLHLQPIEINCGVIAVWTTTRP